MCIRDRSIGEPGTQLTLRTFHTGGTASVGKTESEITTKFDGVVEFDNITFTLVKEGDDKKNVILSRSGEMKIVDPKTKKQLSSSHVPYGATSVSYTHLDVYKRQGKNCW